MRGDGGDRLRAAAGRRGTCAREHRDGYQRSAFVGGPGRPAAGRGGPDLDHRPPGRDRGVRGDRGRRRPPHRDADARRGTPTHRRRRPARRLAATVAPGPLRHRLDPDVVAAHPRPRAHPTASPPTAPTSARSASGTGEGEERGRVGQAQPVAAAYTVVGEAADGRGAVERAAALRPDVVLMDVTMWARASRGKPPGPRHQSRLRDRVHLARPILRLGVARAEPGHRGSRREAGQRDRPEHADAERPVWRRVVQPSRRSPIGARRAHHSTPAQAMAMLTTTVAAMSAR